MIIETMIKAYSYIRFSSAAQAQGDSLRRQAELSAKYAETHKLLLDTSLTLRDEGLSGFTGENRTKGALAVFLKAVESGIVAPGSFLLVESLDRLSRDTLTQQMTLFMGLINADIVVVTLADNQIYSKATIDNDFTKLMISLVVMMRAHEESLMKSRRLKAVWAAKRKNATEEKLTAQCPAWLVLNPDHKTFRLNEERVQIVRRIFQLSLDGVGQHTIARTLNDEGISAWGRRNTGWHASYIRHILQSRNVIGEYQPCRRERGEHRRCIPEGEPIRNYYPAVVELSAWQAVQDRRRTSTPGRVNPRTVNLFAGLAFDGDHGCAMRFMGRSPRRDKNGKREGRWHYLVSDYGRLQAKATASSWRYEWFEAWFLDFIFQLDWHSIAMEKETSAEVALKAKVAQQRAELENVEKSLGRLGKLAAETDTPPQTILSEMAKFEQKRKFIEQALVKTERELHDIEFRQNAITESADRIKVLASEGHPDTRLRLREEIRKKVQRIDVFANGASKAVLRDEELRMAEPGQPCFKITVINGVSRWVFCDQKRPGHDPKISVVDTVDVDPETVEMEPPAPFPPVLDLERASSAAKLLEIAEAKLTDSSISCLPAQKPTPVPVQLGGWNFKK